MLLTHYHFPGFSHTLTDTYDTLFYNSNCIPDSEYIYNDNTISRILYEYADTNSLLSFLPDTIHFCKGDSAQLQLFVRGGIQPYHFQWSSPLGLSSDTVSNPIAKPDTSTIYTVSISDAHGLQQTDTVFVFNEPLPVAYIHIISVDSISPCSSALLITDSVSSVHPDWYYNSDYLSNYYHAYTAAKNGFYKVINKSSYGCSFADSIEINFLSHPQPEINITQGCNFLVAGASDISSLQWFNGGGDTIYGEINDTLKTKVSGYYSAAVIDSHGCTGRSAIVNFHPVSSTINITNSCRDSCSGVIEINPNGFISPVTYSWSTGVTDTIPHLTELCAGTYYLMLNDSAGCFEMDTIKIEAIYLFHERAFASSLTDENACNAFGIIYTANYSAAYQWENGSTAIYADSLCYGWTRYKVSVNGYCTQEDSVFVNIQQGNNNCKLFSNIIPTCPGECNNQINLIAATPNPYSIFRTDSAITGVHYFVTGLCGGDFHFVLIDSTGCVDSMTVHLDDSITITPIINILYYNNNDLCGTIVKAEFSNFTPLSVMWCDGHTGYIDTLCAGDCFIQTQKTNNISCNQIDYFNINIPTCKAFILPKEITCHNICDGQLIASASSSFISHFLWNTGDTTNLISNLCPGNYSVFMDDYNGCRDTVNYEMINPPELTANLVTSYGACTDTCYTFPDISGGIPPYEITWCDTIHSPSFHLCTSCRVYITDSHHCSIEDSVITFSATMPLTLSETVHDASCYICDDGSIVLDAQGGTGNYTYTVGPAIEYITGDSIYNLTEGIYNCCVADDFGCRACDVVRVNYSGSVPVASNDDLKVENNLTANSTKIILQNAPTSTNVSVKLYDIRGKFLEEKKMKKGECELFYSNLEGGIYFFSIETDKEILRKGKLIYLKN